MSSAWQRLRRLPRDALAMVVVRAVSAFGSALTGFALNVWLFKQTGSYSMFATLAVINALPGLLLSPIAGVLVDRYSRKKLLIGCDIASAIAIVLIAIANGLGLLTPTLLIATTLVLSTTRTLSWPAAWVAMSSMTTEQDRPGINGIAEALNGGISIFSPILGALLVELIGIGGIATLDILSYALCIAVTLGVTMASQAPQKKSDQSAFRQLADDCLVGIRWIIANKSLFRLLQYFIVMNLGCSIFAVLYAPYVLAFSNPSTLGVCMALGGIGMIGGGLFYSVIGNLVRSEHAVLLGGFVVGLGMLGFGMMRNLYSIAVFAFLYSAGFSVVSAASQTIWQSHVPLAIQGRVFSVRRMIAFGLNPLSVLISIPFVQAILQPLLLANVGRFDLQQIWGSGQAAPLGLMASLCGALCATVALSMYLFDGLKMNAATAVVKQ